MKKIALVISILSAFFIISCSNDGGDDTERGYVDPGSWSGKTINANKSYTFTGETCTGEECSAIIYRNELNDTNYVGIAVNDKHLGAASDFSLKIYWQSSTIGSVNLAPADYSIKVAKGTNEYTTTPDNLNITVTDEGDGSYSVSFTTNNIVITDPTDLSTFTISIGNSIRAVKYP